MALETRRNASMAALGLILAVVLAGNQISCARGAIDSPAPADASTIEQGRQLFGVHCAFCHGSKATGGEGGPSLLRSATMRADQHGEAIAVVVENGRPDKGMPKFALSAAAISDIAAYLHSLRVDTTDAFDPSSIIVGDAVAGRAYFYGKGRCSQCHSLQGDLAHIGSKYDPKTLQDDIVTGASVGPFGARLPSTPRETASVTLATGERIEGTVVEIDDFIVTLIDTAGDRRSFLRQGSTPRVDVTDPLQFHRDMLREWDDRDLHNLTAFLVKQK